MKIKNFLLDTCALSEPTKPNPNPQFIAWLKGQEDEFGLMNLFVSCLTFGEIQKGISRIDEKQKRHKFEKFLAQTEALFNGRILAIDQNVALRWGQIEGELGKKGVVVPTIVGLLAATATVHALTLVTRNEKDFKALGISILNPWR